jgi:death on curing protein
LKRSGGLDGVRDVTLIESAIARPYSGHHRLIHRKAAALTHSLAKNHGFVDGNKRTALLVLSTFLDRSGYELFWRDRELVPSNNSEEQSRIFTVFEAEEIILAVVENRVSFEDLVTWLRAHVRRQRNAK